ncbi:MAG: hypothetical protein WBE79_12560 [Candidatus Cybelea sp.]
MGRLQAAAETIGVSWKRVGLILGFFAIALLVELSFAHLPPLIAWIPSVLIGLPAAVLFVRLWGPSPC